MAMVKKSIAKLREKAPYVLKRKGHAKQRKKLLKAYQGKRLKQWWSSYASLECFTIGELKDAEHVGHRMKGGHRHNYARNVLERKLNKSKSSRKRCHNHLNKGFNYKFIAGRCLTRRQSDVRVL